METAGRSHLLLLLELEYLLHELVELDHRERSLAAPVVPARGCKGAYAVQGHAECEEVQGVCMGCAWGVHGMCMGMVRTLAVPILLKAS